MMKEDDSNGEKKARKELLDSIGGRKPESQEIEKDNRRGIIKSAALSLFSAIGLKNITNTASAESGEYVNVSRPKAKKAMTDKKDRIAYLRDSDLLEKFEIQKLLIKRQINLPSKGLFKQK